MPPQTTNNTVISDWETKTFNFEGVATREDKKEDKKARRAQILTWQAKVQGLVDYVKADAKSWLPNTGEALKKFKVALEEEKQTAENAPRAATMPVSVKCTYRKADADHLRAALLRAFGPEWGARRSWVDNSTCIMMPGWKLQVGCPSSKGTEQVLSAIRPHLALWGRTTDAVKISETNSPHVVVIWFYPERNYNEEVRQSIYKRIQTQLAELNSKTSGRSIKSKSKISMRKRTGLVTMSIEVSEQGRGCAVM